MTPEIIFLDLKHEAHDSYFFFQKRLVLKSRVRESY